MVSDLFFIAGSDSTIDSLVMAESLRDARMKPSMVKVPLRETVRMSNAER